MRYLPHAPSDIETMLAAIGVDDIDSLLEGVPPELRQEPLTEPKRWAEPALLERYAELAGKRDVKTSFVGGGLHTHYVPVVVDQLISRGEFFSAYTPYQPEAAQGTLQSVFEFQTMVAELMGMDIANASMYDAPSGAAEAALMCLRLHRKRKKLLVSEGHHPDTVAVINTYLHSVDAEVVTIPLKDGRTDLEALSAANGDDVAGILVQSPNCLGMIESLDAVGKECQRTDAKFVVSVLEPTSLGLLKSPGAFGADIAVGEGTGIGVYPSFGGPGVGLFAVKEAYLRQMPGRLAGEAKDQDGQTGYVLTLSTREQHIRREKATSNICTNHGLCALAFGIHAALLGPRGLKDVATQSAQKARYAVAQLKERGVSLKYDGPFYNEFVVSLEPKQVEKAISEGLNQKTVVGFDLSRWNDAWAGGLMVCTSEMHSKEQLDTLVAIIAEAQS